MATENQTPPCVQTLPSPGGISQCRWAAIAVVVLTGIMLVVCGFALQMTIWHFTMEILPLEQAETTLLQKLAMETFGSYGGSLAFHCVLWTWFVLVWLAWQAHRHGANDQAFIISFIVNYICWALGLFTLLGIGAIVLQSHVIVLLAVLQTPWVVSVAPWVTRCLLGLTVLLVGWHWWRSRAR